MRRKILTLALLVANLFVLAFLVQVSPVRAEGGVDACDENEVEGCDCIDRGTVWVPTGCYDNLGTEHICTNGSTCGVH